MPLSRFGKSVFGLALALAMVAHALPVAAEQRLIAHPSVNETALSLNTARLIFSMQLAQWSDGTRTRVFVLADDTSAHRAFSKNLLSLYPRQLRRVWDRRLYSGTGQPPETVADEKEMRTKVATTPGAIGYLSSEMIDDSVHVLQIR